MINQTISHYKILEKLGEGGMGVVYKARDTKLDRIVALKFMPHHITPDAAEEARFLQEAKAASALNHPNVCTIYGIHDETENKFIEMEFVEGVTLRQKLPIEKMSDVLSYGIQIADALQEAHAKGIVHRDIKADNVMVNSKNQIKVMDFGLAKLKGTLKLTRTSSTVGTLAYMAPEQIQGADVDHRSDIFSFGVVLFEMLTGKLPFRGDHEAAIMYSIVNEDPESAQKYKPDVPNELLHVLNRALEKDPSDRYQSAQEMLIDLRRLQKQSTKVTRTSMASMPVMPKELIETPAGATKTTEQKKSNKYKLIASFGVFVLAITILSQFFIKDLLTTREEPFKSITISRLTTSGKATRAAISPDGKYVIHVVAEGERQSLWMRQVATTSNVMIVPPANASYRGITFGNDGNFVYYVVQDDNNRNGALFEIPVLGGSPRRILTDIASTVGFSPDGKQIAFIRQYPTVGEEVLIVANVDATNERKLTIRRGDDFFIQAPGTAPSWSPDGKQIAVAIASNTGFQHINLASYSVADGSQTLLTQQHWESTGRIAWFADGRGLAYVGAKLGTSNSQLWYIAYPEGTVRSITNDLSSYDGTSIGITSDGSTIVATNTEVRSNIWVLARNESTGEPWNARDAVQITSGSVTREGASGIAWTPDKRIVYTSRSGKNVALWIMNNNGSNARQLTVGEHQEYQPSVSPDGRFIAYVSAKDTTPHIWRMDIDGGNAAKLSFAEDYDPSISPDGAFVFYSGWATGKTLLYKVPFTGGDTVQLSTNPAGTPEVSPDGKYLLCRYYNEALRIWEIAILNLHDMSVHRSFTLPNSVESRNLQWYYDGKFFTYIDTRNGVSNIWSLPANGGEPQQLTNFTSGLIFQHEWSRDGNYLAIAKGQETSDVVLITENK